MANLLSLHNALRVAHRPGAHAREYQRRKAEERVDPLNAYAMDATVAPGELTPQEQERFERAVDVLFWIAVAALVIAVAI